MSSCCLQLPEVYPREGPVIPLLTRPGLHIWQAKEWSARQHFSIDTVQGKLKLGNTWSLWRSQAAPLLWCVSGSFRGTVVLRASLAVSTEQSEVRGSQGIQHHTATLAGGFPWLSATLAGGFPWLSHSYTSRRFSLVVSYTSRRFSLVVTQLH